MRRISISSTITFGKSSGARNDEPLNENLDLFLSFFDFDSNRRTATATEVFVLIPLGQDEKQFLPDGNRFLAMGTIEGGRLELFVTLSHSTIEIRQEWPQRRPSL
jgi:hypothetical protein